MNETLTLLMKRRTVRAYQDRPISDADKLAIQQATLRAPTGGNMAPYAIIDVQDPRKKAKLADLCDHQPMIAKAPMVWVYVLDWQKWYDWFRLDHCDEKSGIPMHTPSLGDLDISLQDALIAAQTSVIAAESLGIGSCYIGDIIENGEEVQKLLDLPRFTMPACMLIFGYKPVHDHELPLEERCPVKDMFMTDSYHHRPLEEIQKAYHEQEAKGRSVGRIPYERKGSLADYCYRRKYTSLFMKEMTRSMQYWLRRWCDGDSHVQK